MRKSFTRLFSVFMLLNLFCISVLLAQPAFQGASSIPKQDANNVKPADVTSFVVMFDKAITLTASGGTFAIYDGTSVLLKTIPVPSASVTLGADGKSLVINPGMTLTPGEYHLALTAGTVKDSDGATNAAIVEATGWNFVLGDYVAPKLIAGSNFTPKDDAAHLTPGSFTLVFDEAVAAGTGNIVVYRADGVVVDMIPAGAATYTGVNVTFTPAPTDGFKDMSSYFVKVEAGAIVDSRNELNVAGATTGVFNNNKFAGISDNTTYNFSTKDFTAPVIDAKSVTPASTSATLSVTLNEVGKVKYIVRPASGPGSGAPSASDVLTGAGVNVAAGTVDVTAANTATTGNLASLSTDTNYKVYLVTTVTYSSAPTPYTINGTAVETVEFKTSDGSAPVIISALNNSARINSDDKKTTGIKVHYNEQVVPGSGVITIRRSSDNFGYLNIDASTLTVKKISDTDYEVTIPFATPLVSDVTYYVVMPQGVIKDMQNNPSNEVTQLSGFYITGEDFTVPTVESVKFSTDPNPVLADNIVITFSEQLVSAAIGGGGAIADNNLSIAFESNNSHVNGTITYATAAPKSTITIDPSSNLDPNTTYSVRVRPGVFKDDNNNVINTEISFTLTTRDLGPFTSAYSVPTIVGGANNGKIAKDSKITVTFEKMPTVVSGSTTVAATTENLAALVTFQKVAAPNVNIPFALAFGVNGTSGKYEAVITPTSNLESDIAITFDMDETKLKDSQGNVFGAVAALTGTVADWKSPTVTMKRSGNIYPAYPAFAIEFNEVMFAGGAVADGADLSNLVTVKMTDASGTNVPLTSVLYATATKTITIVPAGAGLELGKTYYYAIGSSLSDAAGNMIPATSVTFTYNDTQVVKAIATSPSKGQTGVVLTGTGSDELAVSVTFDQVADLILGTTNLQRTAYLMPVGSVLIGDAIATHVIVDADLVGSTLSFKFSPLTEGVFNASNAKWYVYIQPDIIKSSVTSALNFPGFPLTAVAGPGANDPWPAMYFVAKDVAKPIATFTPVVGLLALDGNLTYTFDEKVVKGSGNILIKKAGVTELTIDVNSSSVELAGNGMSVVIKHAALTNYSTAYTIEFSAVGTFVDEAGNSLASVGGAAIGTFTTVANPVPTAEYTPAPGSDIVALDANLSIKFSEPVDKVTGKIISLYKWDASLAIPAWALVENILAENTSVSAEIVTINPVANLLANTDYAVQIQTGAYKDKSQPTAANFGGIADFTTWGFSTKNTLAPTATFTFVNRSDDKVATASNIVITFNKPIEKADGSAITNPDIPSLFSLKQTVNAPGGALLLPIALTFNGIISDDKKTVTLNGASYTPALLSLAGYNISAVPGVMRGTTNNGGIGSLNSDFTISDYTKPIATTPSVVSFDEAKIKFSLASNENGKIYYILQAGDASTAVPSAATIMAGSSADYTGAAVEKEFTGLASQTSYVLFVVATDAMGNVSDVDKKVQATKDITPPAMLTKSTMFDKTAKTLSLTFNEDIAVIGNAVIFDKATMTQLASVALSVDGADSKKVNTAAWGAMPLDVNEYYVEVAAGNIKDLATNSFAGLYSTAWVVTTADQTAPTAPAVNPSAAPYAVDQVFTLEFNENVKLVDPMPVSAVVVDEWNGTTWVPYDIVSNVTASNKVITIDPGRQFKEKTDYRLTILANTVSDLAGNKYAASVVKLFTTIDATPAAVTWSPDGSATVLASTTTLTITFDQAIQQLNGSTIESFDLDSLVTLTTTDASVPANTKSINGAGTIITISIPGALKSGTSYTYGFKAKFKGADGVTIPAQSKTFSTKQSPESITITPLDNDADNATRIPVTVDQTFTVSANLPFFTWSATAVDNNLAVTAAYAKTAIKLYPGGTLAGAIDMTVVVSADGRTISLTPASNLNSTANYDLVILPGLLQLGTGNPTAVNTSNIVKEYTTVDVAKPIVDAAADAAPFTDGYAPAITSIVGKASALKLTFNENVMSGAGAVEIRRQDGFLVKSVDASLITYDNKIATILSGMDIVEMPVNHLYYVIIPSGVITDKSGNPYDGISGITAWTFTLKDDVTPQATFTPNNVNGVVISTDLKLMFDRPVVSNPGVTAPTSWIAIYKTDGNAVELIKPTAYPTKVMYSADGMTATIDINTLEQNTTYNVEVSAGAMRSTTAVDFAGVAKTMWSFSTEDNTAPKVAEFMPADKASIDLWENTLSVKFDKNIAKGTGKIAVRKANGDLVQEFDVTSADVTVANDTLSFTVDGLMSSSDYYVIIENSAITNTSTTPEKFAGLLIPTAWTFKTNGDDVIPTAEYAPNGTLAIDLVPAEVELTMTFVEPVVAGLGNLVIYNADGDAVVETIAIEESMISGKVVTIVPTKLEEGISYYVMVDAGSVKDLAGNDYAGIADKATWTFATGDFTAPAWVNKTPIGLIEGNHPVFEITFNEDVMAGTGKLTVYKNTGNVKTLEIPITAAMVSGNKVTVTYAYNATTGGLDKNTLYYVLVDAGAVKDMAGNEAPALTNPKDWTFKTGDFSTEIDPKDASQFKVYPNPFVEFVNVDNAAQLSRIVVTNIAGQTVKEVVNPTNRIQLNELRSGIYFMSLYTTENIIAKTAKIVKR